MDNAGGHNFFDVARKWAVAVMLAAGCAAILGSMLDWVTISARPALVEGSTFEGAENQPRQPKVTQPFSGIDAGDGWWTLAGGAGLAGSGLALLLRRRALRGWTGILSSIVIGAVAIADFRGVGDLTSAIARRMDIVGRADPGLGLTLVAAAALAGMIGSVAGIAASPRPEAIRDST